MASRSAIVARISILIVCHCIVGCFPLQFTAEPMDAVVTPEGVATLKCQTSEASVTVTWYISDGTPIATSGGGKYSQLMDGSLQIASFTSDDVGVYYCVVQNSEGSVQSRNAQLQIAYLGAVSTLEPQMQAVQEYSSHTLSCTVPASIPSANASWFRGSNEVVSSSNIGVTLSHELVFSCIEQANQAPWKCYVSNQFYTNEEMLASDYLLDVLDVENGGLDALKSIELVQNALPVSQSVLVNDTVQFQCFAIGCPVPTFSWSKDGSPISASNSISFTQFGRILIIKDAQLGDAGNYTCSATQTGNPDVHRHSWAVLTVQEPLTVTSSFPATSALASLSANFSCSAQGPEPFSWLWRLNATELVPTDDVQIISNEAESTLIISNLGVNGSGFVQCVASDGQGGYSSAHQLLTVMTVPLEFTNVAECGDILAVVGTDIVILCTATAYPLPSFSWKRNEQPLDIDNNPRFTQSVQMFNGSLTISQASLNDQGVYKCVAHNALATHDGPATIVTMIGQPQIVAQPQDHITSEGSNTFLVCEIESIGALISISYFWTQDGSLYREDQGTGTLTISDVQKSDFGLYECVATIKTKGTCAPPIFFKVGQAFLSSVPPKPPSSPGGLHVTNITHESVQILWSEPEDTGGLKITSYEVMIVSLGRPDCTLGTGSFTDSVDPSAELLQSTTASNLTSYFRYQVAVAATNSNGTGSFSEPSSVLWTDQTAPTGAPGEVLAVQGKLAGEVAVQWQSPPCNESNGVITHYSVEYSMLSSPDSEPVVLSTTTNVTTLTIQLQPLADYLVRVSAHTSAGAGPWSWPLIASSTIAERPGPPTAVSAEAINSTAVLLEWQPPDPLPQPPHNLTAITQYLVKGTAGDVYVSQDTFSLNYTGLEEGTSQTLSVAAINSFGVSDPQTVTVVLPSPSVEALPIYQEVWFLASAGGVALVFIIMVLVFIITVVISVRKRRKRGGVEVTHMRRHASFSSSEPMNGSLPRRETVLEHMMTVEEADNPDLANYQELEDARQEMHDASSVGTFQSQSSSLQLNSRYRYRSPLEQEIYVTQKAQASKGTSDSSSMRSNQSEPTRRWTPSLVRPLRKQTNTYTPPSVHQRLYVKSPSRNSSSPTDTVHSFEYRSQTQVVVQMERLARKQHFRHSSRNGWYQPPYHSSEYDHLPKSHQLLKKQGAEKASSLHPSRMQPWSSAHPSSPLQHNGMLGGFKAGPESIPQSAHPMPADTHCDPLPQNGGVVSPSRMSVLSSMKSSRSSSPKKRCRDLALLTALPDSERTGAIPQAPVPVSNPVLPHHLVASMPLENGATHVLQTSHSDLLDESDISEPLDAPCMANIHRQPTKLAEDEERKAILQRLQQRHRNHGHHDPQTMNMFPYSSGADLPHMAGIPGKYSLQESTFV